MGKDKIAVVILNWNGSEMLRTFLPSVVSNSTEAIIYVADNASSDNSLEVLEKDFPTVRRIVLDKNYGFAEGYNLALKQVEAEYYVLLNSDVEVTSNWLKPMCTYLDEHPETVACQPKIKNWRKKDEFEYAGACGGFLDSYGYPFCRGRLMSTVEKDSGQYDTIAPIFWASGAALFIRSQIYWEAGGLDGRFFAHMEEIDLCWRLNSRGHSLVCIPQSIVYHVGGATLKKENPRKTFLNFRNNLIMIYKNSSNDEMRKVLNVRCMLDYVAAFTFLLKGQLPNAKAVIEARKEFKKKVSDFTADRLLNLSKIPKTSKSKLSKGSILVKYYLGRKHNYSDL